MNKTGKHEVAKRLVRSLVDLGREGGHVTQIMFADAAQLFGRQRCDGLRKGVRGRSVRADHLLHGVVERQGLASPENPGMTGQHFVRSAWYPSAACQQ